jgi:hypothetical protein
MREDANETKDRPVALRAVGPGGPGPAPRTFSDGRICREFGCSTLLSRYNGGELCWQHQPRARVILESGRGRARRDPALRMIGLDKAEAQLEAANGVRSKAS